MDPEEFIDILFSARREECNELALVLAAQAIPTSIRWDGRSWLLSVPRHSAALARMEVEAYRAESKLRVPHREVPAQGRPWPGILGYALVLILMAVIAPELHFGIDWLAVGRMDGGRMVAGEWWRPVTALTLHADAAHLLGNLVFGGFFAYSVARYLGGGFGWLAIITSAACGNLVNGLLLGADHRSIGASTAVFAALGLLSAYLWRRGFPTAASNRERIAPVIAGLGLLAFTGTGGVNTDLGAHLFGFMAGFCAGLVVAWLGVPEGRKNQIGAAIGAIGLVVGAWSWALLARS